MATRKKTAASSKKKSAPKQVIEHDPFSMAEEDESTQSAQAMTVEKKSVDVGSEKKSTASEPTEKSAPVEESDCIDLGSSLVISEVEVYRTTLLNALQEGGELVLDGGDIQQIDGAGLQLLSAFAKETGKIGVTYKWKAASQGLCEAASQLGLTEMLQLNETCQAA
ncbi:STAS domain-containing protein [Pseudomonadota bacterium]